jgi:putative transposase
VEKPGRNVKAKSGLNKAILDQGLDEFRRQLDYKLAWNGGHLVAVPPQYTSQRCPCCGQVSAENRRTQSKFECTACGYENNADVVGAINIRAAGQAVLACGGTVPSDRPVKQEPAEANLRGALCAA